MKDRNVLSKVIAEKVVAYRPSIRQITGTMESAILLQQISYWWYAMNEQPFYKFFAPCDHELYHKGDSWEEELGISYYEIQKALEKIAKKITRGVNKKEAKEKYPVVYWTDSSRLTWFQFNPDTFELLYNSKNTPINCSDSEDSNYLSSSIPSNYLITSENEITFNTEINTENTTKINNTNAKKIASDLPAHADSLLASDDRRALVEDVLNFPSLTKEERDKSTETQGESRPILDRVDVLIGNVSSDSIKGDDYRSRVARAMVKGIERENSQDKPTPDLSFVPEYTRPLALAFCENFGRSPIGDERGWWIKCWKEQAELGITPDLIVKAFKYMRSNNLSITSPRSVTSIADGIRLGNVKDAVQDKMDNDLVFVGGVSMTREEFYRDFQKFVGGT